ncbi:MAG: TRAP transporter small permease [Pseudomonadota bacterium]|nr:TRAP transporter small permease [Pseudomonadota bacterium]
MRIVEWILSLWVGVSLTILMLVVFIDVFMRNVFDSPLSAGTEITELSMAAMAFGAFPLLALRSGHISVELIPFKPGGWVERFVQAGGSILTAVIFGLLAWQAWVFSGRAARSGEEFSQLGLNWSFVYDMILACSVATVIGALVAAVLEFTRKAPEHRDTQV